MCERNKNLKTVSLSLVQPSWRHYRVFKAAEEAGCWARSAAKRLKTLPLRDVTLLIIVQSLTELSLFLSARHVTASRPHRTEGSKLKRFIKQNDSQFIIVVLMTNHTQTLIWNVNTWKHRVQIWTLERICGPRVCLLWAAVRWHEVLLNIYRNVVVLSFTVLHHEWKAALKYFVDGNTAPASDAIVKNMTLITKEYGDSFFFSIISRLYIHIRRGS